MIYTMSRSHIVYCPTVLLTKCSEVYSIFSLLLCLNMAPHNRWIYYCMQYSISISLNVRLPVLKNVLRALNSFFLEKWKTLSFVAVSFVYFFCVLSKNMYVYMNHYFVAPLRQHWFETINRHEVGTASQCTHVVDMHWPFSCTM